MSSRTLRIAVIISLAALLGWALWTASRDPAPERPRRPLLAPGFRLPVVQHAGEQLRLRSLRGKGVLLVFWSSAAESDPGLLSLLSRVQQRYGGDHFQLVALTDDPADTVRTLAQRLPFPVLADAGGRVAARYRVAGLPTAVFVGPDGRRAGRLSPPLDEAALTEAVERLIAHARARARRSVVGFETKG